MVAPDSHIPAADLAPEAYGGRPDDIQGLQLEDRAPSLTISEEPAPPLGGSPARSTLNESCRFAIAVPLQDQPIEYRV